MCEISVIIPVYNKKRYVVNAVKSVLHQTFDDFEILLIDDGSTDGSGAICDKLSETDARVKVFHTKNQGVSAARNFGLRKASGTYISFIDADDCVDQRFLEKLYEAIKANGAGLAVCGYFEIKYGKRIRHVHKNYYSGNKDFEILRDNLTCILWNKLFVREKIKHLFDENVSTCEDSLFCARYYYDNNPKVVYVNEELYGYLVRKDGLTSELQKGAFAGVNKYLLVNRKISEQITDEHLKYLAVHHVYKVYFYGIYLFIFQTICKGPLTEEKLAIIEQVVNDRNYRRIMKYIIKYPLRNRPAERTTFTEFMIIILSLLKLKRTIWFYTKIRKSAEPFLIRLGIF